VDGADALLTQGPRRQRIIIIHLREILSWATRSPDDRWGVSMERWRCRVCGQRIADRDRIGGTPSRMKLTATWLSSA
jgi:hypothetical protein